MSRVACVDGVVTIGDRISSGAVMETHDHGEASGLRKVEND
jgi:hypothetical protein